jgi:hypothetical protein
MDEKTNTVKDVEVFEVGTWNHMKFSETDIDDIVKNTNDLISKKKHQAPIKLGHTKNQILAQQDGQPALGWLHNFRKKGTKLIADFKNVPDIVMEAIKKKLYIQVSIELNHIARFGWYARGLALLGADLPAVHTLEDLTIYFSDKKQRLGTTDAFLCFSEPYIKKDFKMDNIKTNELEEENKKLKSLMGELNDKIKKLDFEKKEQAVKESKLAFTSAKGLFLESYKKEMGNGKLTPVFFHKLEKEIDNQEVNFSKDSGFTVSTELLKELPKAYVDSGVGEETSNQDFSNDGNDQRIDEIVAEKATKLMLEKNISYTEASALVFSSDKKLSKRYNDFTMTVSAL